MSTLIKAGKTADFKDGMMKNVLVQEHEILLARIDNNYYATDNLCPHMGGRLSEGKLEGSVVTCPRHGSRFDLKNGEVIRWLKGSGFFTKVGSILKPPKQLATYKVSVDNDGIFIEFD